MPVAFEAGRSARTAAAIRMLPTYRFFTGFSLIPPRTKALKKAALLGKSDDLAVAQSQYLKWFHSISELHTTLLTLYSWPNRLLNFPSVRLQ